MRFTWCPFLVLFLFLYNLHRSFPRPGSELWNWLKADGRRLMILQRQIMAKGSENDLSEQMG